MTVTGPYPTREPRAAAVTSAIAGVSGSALIAVGAYDGSPWALAFGAAAVILAAYELAAIYTDDVPTVTEAIKGGGWPVRIATVVLGALALLDHFVTGVVL